jgi:DNA-binding transcriptional LysR family regulator
MFTDEISSGRVRIILDAFEPSALPIYTVYPSRRLLSAKVRAMIDFLAVGFAASPLLRGDTMVGG